VVEREDPQDGTEGTEPGTGGARREPPREEARGGLPLDEDAAWAQIVASYDEEPADGGGGWPAAEDLPEDPEDPDDSDDPPPPVRVNDGIPVIPRAFVVRAPVYGPRDYPAPDEEDDEGHFVPPEPPPLPEADVTAKFAWLAVLGGPLLMLVFVLLQQPLPLWALVVGVGGFLGGFATLIYRMKDPEDDEDDDPHGGAVV
jgi:hypothetical protein